MPRKDLTTRHVEGVARGVEAVSISSKVSRGPQPVIGRDVSTFLDADDIALLVSSLAAMPAFRQMFRAVADELDRREAVAGDTSASPPERLSSSLGSVETTSAVRRVAREAIGAGR
jgi:hypothetical protein